MLLLFTAISNTIEYTLIAFLYGELNINMLAIKCIPETPKLDLYFQRRQKYCRHICGKIKARPLHIHSTKFLRSDLGRGLRGWAPMGEPIAIPSIWSYTTPSNKKLVFDVQNVNNSNNSDLVILRLVYFSKIKLTAKFRVSLNGKLVNKTANVIRNGKFVNYIVFVDILQKRKRCQHNCILWV